MNEEPSELLRTVPALIKLRFQRAASRSICHTASIIDTIISLMGIKFDGKKVSACFETGMNDSGSFIPSERGSRGCSHPTLTQRLHRDRETLADCGHIIV